MPPAGVAVAVTALVMTAAVQPSLAAPTQVLQQSVASTPTLTPTPTDAVVPADASAPACASCPPEIAADPLVAYSQQFSDAIDLWSQSSVTSLLCVVSGPTSYQISIQPSAATAPVGAWCLTKDGTDIGSAPAPVPPVVSTPLPLVQVVPSPAGTAFPTPAQDIVIEQHRPVLTPTPTPTPAPSSSRTIHRPVPTPVLDPPSDRPAPIVRAPSDASAASAPVVVQPRSEPSPSVSATSAASADSVSSGQSSDTGANASDPSSVATPAMRSLSAVQLGTGLVDPYAFDPNNPPVPDPSVVPFNALLLGNALTPILSVDSTPIYVADLPFMLTLTPAQAAPLAGGGLAGPFRVRAFNAETGALDELPTKLSLGDDGSVTLAISTPVVRPAAVPQPVVVDNSAPVVEDSVAANRDDAGSFSSDDAAAGSVDDWVAPAVDAAAAPPDDASALRVDDASQVTGDSADLTGLDEGAAPTP